MSKITDICGDYPNGFEKKDFESNPNYLFVNDENYAGVTVYDEEGNSVFMNSFEECEHYVSGGWSFNSNTSNETFYENSIAVFIIFFLVGSYIFKKFTSLPAKYK